MTGQRYNTSGIFGRSATVALYAAGITIACALFAFMLWEGFSQ
jgi:hypothetical protein